MGNGKFEQVTRMIRYGAMSFLTQLEAIPVERRDRRPEPAAHSAMEIAEEVISVFVMHEPLLEATDAKVKWVQIDRTPPKSVEEAWEKLMPAVEAYIQTLEASGPELRRQQPMPFGGAFWAEDAATYPLLDFDAPPRPAMLPASAPGLDDAEQHWDEQAIRQCFMR